MEENANNSSPAPTPPEHKSGNKSLFQINKINKTVLLVIGLVILTGVLLFISLASKNNSLIPGISKNEEEVNFAHTSLSISEEVRQSAAAGKYETDINIDTTDNKVTGVQLEVSFDPLVLRNVDIVSGDFLTDPVVIQKTIDQANGTITYVLGAPLGGSGMQGKGVVAVISFTKAGNAETTIGFLPQTLVTAEGQDESVLKETAGASISTLPSGASNTSTASPAGSNN